MIAFGLLLLVAHLGGKLSEKLKLSDVTGQLIGGALVGPYVLGPTGILKGSFATAYESSFQTFHFFTMVFLCMMAFGIGEELLFVRIKQVGKSAIIICLFQAVLTWVLITLGFYFIGKIPFIKSALIGSIGIATAPAVTFVLINKFNIKGRLKGLLGNMVVLDDLIEVLVFSCLLQIAVQKLNYSTVSFSDSIFPVARDIFLAILLGAIMYVMLRLLVSKRSISFQTFPGKEEESELKVFLENLFSEPASPSVQIFILVLGSVALTTGIGYYFHLPFLITAIVAGFLVANFHSHTIFDSLKLHNIISILNLCFFALIGANISFFNISSSTAFLVGLYILARLIGKLLGTWFGCILMKEQKEVIKTLPFLMLPQAGVAAVESVFVGMVLGDPQFIAIILPAILFFEVGGIFISSRSLNKLQFKQ